MNKKKLATALAVFVFVMGVVVTVPQAHAQERNTNFFQGLIQMIAQKFGLDQSKVQSVVNEYQQQQKQTRQQNMQNKEKSRFDQLVKDGKITSAQEQAILTELQNLRNKYNPTNETNETPEQRKTQMQQMQTDLKSWAQSQGIDPSILQSFGGRGMRWGMHRKGMMNISPSPSPTQ